MSISLYMDEQVPKPITIGLRQRGVDVLTVQEDGRSSYPDPLLVDQKEKGTSPLNLFMEKEKMYFETCNARNTVSADSSP